MSGKYTALNNYQVIKHKIKKTWRSIQSIKSNRYGNSASNSHIQQQMLDTRGQQMLFTIRTHEMILTVAKPRRGIQQLKLNRSLSS